MDRALIIGCGYTGQFLARRLLSGGTTVAATRLQGCVIDGIPSRPLDLRAGPAPAGALQAQGAVVYYMVSTLARAHDPAQGPHLKFMDNALSRLEGRPRALIYLSSTSVYGDLDGAWADEDTPTVPGSPWGTMRLELELRLRQHGRDLGAPACVVRLPEIYGPGRGPVARLRQGYTLRFPERWSNRIHVEDLARVLAALGRRPDRDLLLVCDDEPARSGEVYDHAASLLGLGPVPRGGQQVDDENRLALMRDSKRCSNRNLMKWYGKPLIYPTYREGLPSTL